MSSLVILAASVFEMSSGKTNRQTEVKTNSTRQPSAWVAIHDPLRAEINDYITSNGKMIYFFLLAFLHLSLYVYRC